MEMIIQFTLILVLAALLMTRVFYGPALRRRLLGIQKDADDNRALKPVPVHAGSHESGSTR